MSSFSLCCNEHFTSSLSVLSQRTSTAPPAKAVSPSYRLQDEKVSLLHSTPPDNAFWIAASLLLLPWNVKRACPLKKNRPGDNLRPPPYNFTPPLLSPNCHQHYRARLSKRSVPPSSPATMLILPSSNFVVWYASLMTEWPNFLSLKLVIISVWFQRVFFKLCCVCFNNFFKGVFALWNIQFHHHIRVPCLSYEIMHSSSSRPVLHIIINSHMILSVYHSQ